MLAAHSLINIATNKIGQNFTPRIGDLWQDLSSYTIYSIVKGKDLGNNDIFTASVSNGYLLYSYDAKNWAIGDAGKIFNSVASELARMISFAQDADNSGVLITLEDLKSRIFKETGEWPEYDVENEDLVEVEAGA